MDKADHSKTARNSVLVLALIAASIVAGNLLVDRSGDSALTETTTAQAAVVSSESTTLTAFNLAAEATALRIEETSRATEAEGKHLQQVAARELEAARHRQATTQAPARMTAQMTTPQKPQEDFGNLPGSVTQDTLDAIASCESGGDPKVISSNGLYHGKYQFSPETWATVGGKGLPSDASEAEQDYRAALLYERSGPGPWPVCGQ